MKKSLRPFLAAGLLAAFSGAGCASVLSAEPSEEHPGPFLASLRKQKEGERKKINIDQLSDKIWKKLIQLISEEAGPTPAAGPPEGKVEEYLADKIEEHPPALSAKQFGPPSSTNLSPTVADRPSFSELLSLAFDNGFVASGEGTASLNLNPFAFMALAKPEIVDRQTQYGKYELLRRFGASVSLGGEGDSFDRDGDGKKDEALKAENLFDILTWEAKFRALGSRDKRDRRNFGRFLEAVGGLQKELDRNIQRFLLDHDKDIFEESPAGKVCYEDKVAELFKRPEVENELQGIAAVFERMDEEIERVSKKIDRSPVLTISADGTVRDGDKYGPQKFSVGLVGVGGWGNWDHTFNARWSRLEGLRGNPAGTQWKIASEASTVWLKNSWLSPEGITVAAGLAAEFYKKVHRTF
jgi:hypothetical protein